MTRLLDGCALDTKFRAQSRVQWSSEELGPPPGLALRVYISPQQPCLSVQQAPCNTQGLRFV